MQSWKRVGALMKFKEMDFIFGWLEWWNFQFLHLSLSISLVLGVISFASNYIKLLFISEK